MYGGRLGSRSPHTGPPTLRAAVLRGRALPWASATSGESLARITRRQDSRGLRETQEGGLRKPWALPFGPWGAGVWGTLCLPSSSR